MPKAKNTRVARSAKKRPAKQSPASRFSILRLLLLSLLLAYPTLLIFGCAAADRLIFPVPANPGYSARTPTLIPLPLGHGHADVPALWYKNPSARWTVLYFHGNAMDIGTSIPYLNAIHKAGYSVLAVEYPGYGITEGKPSEEDCYLAATAGYNFLRTTQGIPAEQIIAYGFSLGTGVATDLAARQPLGALVLESPFLSTFRVVTKVKIAPFDRFDNLAKIDRVTCPLLVIHGDADSVVPFSHGEKLFAAAKNTPRKQFYAIPNGGHGDLLQRAATDYRDTLARFLAATPPEESAPPPKKNL